VLVASTMGVWIAVSLSAAPGPCPHPYFPLDQNLTLTFRAGKSEFVMSFQDTQTTPQGQTATMQVQFKERVGKTKAECSAEGIKTELGGLESLAIQAAGVDAKVLSSEGVAMPPASELKPGKTWSNKLALQGNVPLKGALPSLKITTQFTKEATVIGEDTVRVQAGKFKALKLLNKTIASSGGGGPESDRAVESWMLIAPGLGIIKIQTGDSVDLELLKIDRAKTPAAQKKAQR
jgi:hypothetical protein